MSVGMSDAFVTLSADNETLSSVPGLAANAIRDWKFLLLKNLSRRPRTRLSNTTTGCVKL
jgi:hypothetical protein